MTFLALLLIHIGSAHAGVLNHLRTPGQFKVVANETKKNEKMLVGPRHEEIYISAQGGLAPEVARNAIDVEIDQIKLLYSPRRSPYAGEISDLNKCDEQLKPIQFTMTILSNPAKGIVGGVSDRNSFGACNNESIAKIGAQILFFDSQNQEIVTVKIFARKGRKLDEIKKIIQELFE